MVFSKRIYERRLGEILVEIGVLSEEKLQKALDFQKTDKRPIGEILISLGYVKEEDVVHALCLQYGFPYLPLDNYEIDPKVIEKIPLHIPLVYKIVPIDIIGKTLICATPEPLNIKNLENVEKETGLNLQIFVCRLSEFNRAFKKYFQREDSSSSQGPARR